MTVRKIASSMTESIIRAIEEERDYQDKKHGSIREHPHTVAEWYLIMKREMDEVEAAYFQRPSKRAMLDEIRQVVAVGIACIQQHGVVSRSDR